MNFSCVTKVFAGEKGTHLPVLGGWIAAPGHIADINNISLDVYWENPKHWSIEAYKKLQTDAVLDIYIPKAKEDFRCVDHNSYIRSSFDMDIDDVIAEIDAWPETEIYAEELARGFNDEYAEFSADLLNMQALCGQNMLYMPPKWGAGAKCGWYDTFGYENFFLLIGMYEKHARKMLERGGVMGRHRSGLVARAVKEGIYPKAVLMGEDICTQRGPMVSPEFLEKYYMPQLKQGLEPLLEVGCRPVWHSDGDTRPIVDMLIDSGIGGMQGFQPECGLSLEYVASKRTRDGGKMLIFGPLAVTTELPVFTPQQVRDRILKTADIYYNNVDWVLFTGNTINPDVPLANIYAMYETAREIRYS